MTHPTNLRELTAAETFAGPFWDAVKSRNLEILDAILADGLILYEPWGNVMGSEGGAAREGAESYKALIQTVSNVRVEDFTARELAIVLDDGGTAVTALSGHFVLSSTFPGGSVDRVTITYRGHWRREASGWRMHRYVGNPAPDTAASREPFLPFVEKLRAALVEPRPHDGVHLVEALRFGQGKSQSVFAKVTIGDDTAAVSALFQRDAAGVWRAAEFNARLDAKA